MSGSLIEERRLALAGNPDWNGLDALEVVDDAVEETAPAEAGRQRKLTVRFINPLSPGQLTRENLRILGGERLRGISVLDVEAQSDPRVLSVKLSRAGDLSRYELRLVDAGDESRPPAGFDRLLASLPFTFWADCASGQDCASPAARSPQAKPGPELDYLARDYPGFRQLMLDRLAQTVPGWSERNAADTGVALVELLAWVADRLAWQQDFVATEAYLGTARLRSSVRRHARLIDHQMLDGANARALVQLRAAEGIDSLLVRRRHEQDGEIRPAQILSRCADLQALVEFGSDAHRAALATGPLVFELLHDQLISAALNDLRFYTWGARRACLEAGATRATLRGHFPDLKAGALLVFAEVRNPSSGEAREADPARRHPVRLSRVLAGEDPLGGQFEDPPHAGLVAITGIEWEASDALPFALTLAWAKGDEIFTDVSLAHGNIVAVDHGLSREAVALQAVPWPDPVLAPVLASGGRQSRPARYRPVLAEGPLTQASAFDPAAPASELLEQDPGQAQAQIWLTADGEVWRARRDLLDCSADDPAFVAEVEDDGLARLRFGDGEFGRRPAPATRFTARYRIGNGSAGRCGAGALAHLATAQPELQAGSEAAIVAVWNPLPSCGGIEPETIASVRRLAPDAIQAELERAVTPADLEALALRERPDLQRAHARSRWTGSWHTLFLAGDRAGGAALDAAERERLRAGLERYRLAGQDLVVDEALAVPLELALSLTLTADAERARVRAELAARLGCGTLPDGSPALFHPDRLSFGQTVYLSPIVAAALCVTGVEAVAVRRFRRQGSQDSDGIRAGRLDFARQEIPRLDNDRNFPERGTLTLELTGGR